MKTNFLILILFTAFSFKVKAEPNNFLTLLENLSNAPAASGFEEPVRKILEKEWKPLLTEMKIDGMGNLIGTLEGKGSEKKPRILLMAHMDEVGFFVREITKEGYLRIDPAGSWLDPVLLSQRWEIMTPKGAIEGITGAESVHIADPEAVGAVPSKKLFIDIGAKSDQECLDLGIRTGSPVTPKANFSVLKNQERYVGKAFDDRVGLVVISSVLREVSKKDLPNTLLVAATAQEEVGMRGAEVIFPSTEPDLVINIDIGLARDFPSLFSFNPLPVALGKGPTIFAYDRTMIPNNQFVEYVLSTAKKKGLSIQFDVGDDYGEDGCRLQTSGKGIPVVNLGIPVRYPHSHLGIVDRKDIDATISLIVELLIHLNKEEVSKIKTFRSNA